MPLKKLQDFFKPIIQDIGYQLTIINRRKQIPIVQEIERLRSSDRYQNPKSLIPYYYSIIPKTVFLVINAYYKEYGYTDMLICSVEKYV